MCNSMIAKNGRVLVCGQCDDCLKLEAWRWTQRVRVEMLFSKTWFLTLTYRGEIPAGYTEIQKMFKRLRKKHDFRYLAVAELGEKEGRLHYHCVIHGNLTKREVRGEWSHGFSDAKLASSSSDAVARYVSKYISKAKSKVGGRCYRASIGYGKKQVHQILDEHSTVQKVMEYFPDSRVVRVNGIKMPYKIQYKNSTEQKNTYKKYNAIRRHGT